MAQSKTTKKLFNMAYGIGASIVIIGALFKILHWEIPLGGGAKIGGGTLLAIGLITEALIFFISAFEPVEDDLDWSLVYPELAGGQAVGGKKKKVEEPKDAQGLLSKKLDEMLKEAKLDSELMSSLGDSIRSFKGAAEGIKPTTEAMTSTKKYSEEMALAAAQMESLNSLYKVQVESGAKQAEANQAIAENATKLQEQMAGLANNLSSLNSVYGNMLGAMKA
ncbi:gliding motility protein GldL [Nonlabens sp. MIC269]|uniref:type IX secretion system motor protein PorL/GldL n=1 Tax=Nonlabens TaxID=363408 RepID=UPI000722FD62|nr:MULTISPECIES: gliding motility protein GldL [Nonlabens]ALM21821.1 gliding motility protein GldL [Nonlabens sp. MIC269]ARN71441.1 gliding motility protein GldL [Nonlabens tegetincola]MEE2801712.1 gliding motility protein GldL [Bacteroidota bacterium]PQJ13953.1 gliding motility protein GldL [Nonlabens tegetincola]